MFCLKVLEHCSHWMMIRLGTEGSTGTSGTSGTTGSSLTGKYELSVVSMGSLFTCRGVAVVVGVLGGVRGGLGGSAEVPTEEVLGLGDSAAVLTEELGIGDCSGIILVLERVLGPEGLTGT